MKVRRKKQKRWKIFSDIAPIEEGSSHKEGSVVFVMWIYTLGLYMI
jgi:hypothetical protein